MRARDLMSSPAITVTARVPVRGAAALLVSHGFTALPVVDDDKRLVGIVTEADLLGGEPGGGTVGEVMTSPVETVDADTPAPWSPASWPATASGARRWWTAPGSESCGPIRATPRASAKSSHSNASREPSGASSSEVEKSGATSSRRSTLPFGVTGSSSRGTTAAGTMKSGSVLAACSRSPAGVTPPSVTT